MGSFFRRKDASDNMDGPAQAECKRVNHAFYYGLVSVSKSSWE